METANVIGKKDRILIYVLAYVLIVGQSFSVVCAGQPPLPDESAVNRVLSLDGDGDYVRIADSQSLHSCSDAITIEVWVKASSFYTEHKAINCIIRKNITADAENFLIRFRIFGGKPLLEMSLGSEIGVPHTYYEFTVGTWYYLAGTYDGSTATLLVNGVILISENMPGRLNIDESDLYVGKGDPEFSLGEYFHGTLDELRIWNVARSQEEIRAAMNAPLTGKEEGLVAYLNFDDGTAKDLSGHGNDGLLNADARIVESPYPSSLALGGEKAGKLLAWWKFDNDANDSAGGNHGTVNGNPTYADGKFGRSISLDGDDYVDCGNPDLLNFGAGDWTISAWIKTTQSGIEDTDKGTVFANGADGGGGIRYTIAVNEGQTNSIALTTDNDAHKAQAIGKAAVNDGAWHHIVGIRNAEQLRVYVDGVLDGGNYLPAGYDLSGTSQHNAYIGVITDNRDNNLFKHFVGLIDEVCIISGGIDANGVRALYTGKDPMTVAQTAVVKPQARPRPVTGASARGGIEGDWQIISDQVSSNAVIEIRRESDGTLGAVIVAESAEAPAIPLNNVTFENSKLRFEMPSDQGAFEGAMKEDGVTIEGQFQQQDQVLALVLKRVDAAPSEVAPTSQEQLQDRTSDKSNIAIALILVLTLAGVVAGIVFFLVKSSIR